VKTVYNILPKYITNNMIQFVSETVSDIVLKVIDINKSSVRIQRITPIYMEVKRLFVLSLNGFFIPILS
jgi:hypothetical protein